MMQSEEEIIGLSGDCIDEMFGMMAPHLSKSESDYMSIREAKLTNMQDGVWACTDSVRVFLRRKVMKSR